MSHLERSTLLEGMFLSKDFSCARFMEGVPLYMQGFNKGWVPGKLFSREDDFAGLETNGSQLATDQ